jgi:hypothetical protein
MPERGDPSTIRVAGALILLFGLQTQRIHHPCADHVVLQHDNTYPTAGPHPIPLPPRLGSLTSSTCGSAGTAKRNCLADLNTYLDPVNYVFCDQDDDDKYTPHLWAYDYDKLADVHPSGLLQYRTVDLRPRHRQPETPVGQRLHHRHQVATAAAGVGRATWTARRCN